MDACRRSLVAALVVVVGCLASTAAAGADAIGRASLNGSNIQPNFTPTEDANVQPPLGVAVAVDGAHIYWANYTTDTIGRANLDGSGIDPSFIRVRPFLGEGPLSVAIDAAHIYWSTGADVFYGSVGYIGRANLDGSGIDDSFIKTGSNLYPGLAVDGAHISWTNFAARSIGRANLDGSAVETNFIKTDELSRGLAVDASHIYWTGISLSAKPGQEHIGRANRDGSGIQRSFISAGTTGERLSGLAVDAGHVYWNSYHRGSPDTIDRAKLDGSSIQRGFITVQRALLGGLAVNGAHIYWGSSVKATILTLQVAPHTFALTGRRANGRCLPENNANRTRPPCTRPIRLRIIYGLNLPATVWVTMKRVVTGRLVKGSCVAPTLGNPRNRACTRLVEVPWQTYHRGKVGRNTFTLNLLKGKKPGFSPGSYQLTATPGTPPEGNAKSIRFHITR
jgi:virginiamycin B lyase